jgi:hypothetical protein
MVVPCLVNTIIVVGVAVAVQVDVVDVVVVVLVVVMTVVVVGIRVVVWSSPDPLPRNRAKRTAMTPTIEGFIVSYTPEKWVVVVTYKLR